MFDDNEVAPAYVVDTGQKVDSDPAKPAVDIATLTSMGR